jgi:hypothetical protein
MYFQTRKPYPLGSYVAVSNPGFPDPSAFPDMQAGLAAAKCSGKCGCSRGRRCKGRRAFAGLGQDSDLYTGLTPSGDVDTAWMAAGTASNPTPAPGYGPSLVSPGPDYYPAGSSGSAGPYATAANLSPAYSTYAGAPSASTPSLNLTFGSAPAPSSSFLGLSMTEILLGGLGVVAVVMLSGKRR